jgi:hypothetical protein
MIIRFTCVCAALTFASELLSLDAQATQPGWSSRADLFIKTFGPQSNSTSLRASELEQQVQVRLAFYGIDSNRAQMARGTLDQETGNRSIEGFEQTIRNYIHDSGNEALVLANQGRISDVPTIREPLAALLTIARQDNLMGHEELAKEAQEKMLKTLTDFSLKFSKTCYDQPLDPDFVRDLQNQNDTFKTGIDVTPCAKRRHTFGFEGEGVYGEEWTNCSTSGNGKWVIKAFGSIASGSGEGTVEVSADRKSLEGSYTLTTFFKQMPWKSVQQGRMKVTVDEKRAKDGTLIERSITVNVERPPKINYNLAPDQFSLDTVVRDTGEIGWCEYPVKTSDKPCHE